MLGIALLKKSGLVTVGDFLDCIDKDTPAGKRETHICIYVYVFYV